MKRTKTTEVIIETDEIFVALRTPAPVLRRCESCSVEVEMVTPETAAFMRGTPPRNIYRLVERGAVHFVETPSGELLLCADSILSQ